MRGVASWHHFLDQDIPGPLFTSTFATTSIAKPGENRTLRDAVFFLDGRIDDFGILFRLGDTDFDRRWCRRMNLGWHRLARFLFWKKLYHGWSIGSLTCTILRMDWQGTDTNNTKAAKQKSHVKLLESQCRGLEIVVKSQPQSLHCSTLCRHRHIPFCEQIVQLHLHCWC